MRRRRVRSVLCVPLLKQTRLIGVIHLENNLTAGAFTPARITLLELLASEAAISLENARLYRDLQEREARVRRLVDSNIIGIVIWHTDGRILHANESFLRIIGYAREKLAAGHLAWTDLPPPDWRDRDAQALAEVTAVGSVQAYEKEYLRKEGTRVPVLVGGAIFDAVPDEGVAFVIDLTEQKRTEAVLRESERDFRLLVETIPALVWRGTPEGALDYLNVRAVEYLGHTAEALTGGRWIELVHPDHRDATVQRWLQSVTTGSSYDDTYKIRRADGQYRWIQSIGEPFYDAAGRIAHWYGLVIDIDDQKRAEERVRLAYEHLTQAQQLSKTGSFTADLSRDEHYWSEEAYRICDFEAGTNVTIQRLGTIVHPEDLTAYEAS